VPILSVDTILTQTFLRVSKVDSQSEKTSGLDRAATGTGS